MKTHSRYSVARGFLVFRTLFIGLGAVAGALCMLIDPSGKAIGMDAMLSYFKKTSKKESVKWQEYMKRIGVKNTKTPRKK